MHTTIGRRWNLCLQYLHDAFYQVLRQGAPGTVRTALVSTAVCRLGTACCRCRFGNSRQILRDLLCQRADGLLWAEKAKKSGTGAGRFCALLFVTASGTCKLTRLVWHRHSHLVCVPQANQAVIVTCVTSVVFDSDRACLLLR